MESEITKAPLDTSQPVLIYDGDCGFCFYWANYWHALTGDTVQYKPYQQVGAQYPTISQEEFQSAVQYIAPDGKMARAAEASFLTLSNAPGKSFWLTLYRKLPGFAFLSEKAYDFISKHRSFFYYISLLLWGRNYQPPRYNVIAWLFLRVFGLIYLSAFISFSMQALGLIGSQGIIPVSELTTGAYDQVGALAYWLLPMVFWINSSDLAIQLTCWGGIVLSVLLVFNVLPRVSLILLYLLYLSLVCAGQFFMSFQWDSYLLETGIIALFLFGSTKNIGVWLLRWLLFRFMFVAGMVKMFSGDWTWRTYNALSYYFNTEPLPTPLAWYANNLPQKFLSFATGATLFIEIVMPFLIFFPRHLRFCSAFAILFLQSLILLTGNYNFFNILTILLCLTLFDDAAVSKILPQRFSQWVMRKSPYVPRRKSVSYVAYTFIVITVLSALIQFDLKMGGNMPMPVLWVQQIYAPLRITNTYGPFAVMTTQRLEIIIEGSDDGVDWREYEFKYKPGDVNRRPPWNIPLQPRLDWQMWFAALGTANDNLWIERLLQRILENSPAVMGLLGDNPFPDKPPLYVRAQFYNYNFTTSDERDASGAWWTRQLMGNYFPPVHLKDK